MQAYDSGSIYDLMVIGGGINGCGLARDAAGRSLSVFLAEADDLAGGTSSASSKLIHGGLRYLETGALHMVRHALKERAVLHGIAPHLVQPLDFVLPYHPKRRPWWMLRIGLMLYGLLGRGGAAFSSPRALDLQGDIRAAPLQPVFTRALSYSDGWTDDARLVVLNALDAHERGARIATRTRAVKARREQNLWRITLETPEGPREVSARALVNATGPWTDRVNRDVLGSSAPPRTRLVKGSHIVTRKLFEGPHAYILQHDDGRIVFALPFCGDFTLIGTTDVDGTDATVSPEEVTYLCVVVNSYFRQAITPEDVIWRFAGVRPLYEDGPPARSAQRASRDYKLALEAPEGAAPLLTIYGGKLTVYRRVAEEALAALSRHLPISARWTATAPLPGGDLSPGGLSALAAEVRARHPYLAESHIHRWVRAYGTRVHTLLHDVHQPSDLGRHITPELTEREVNYLMRHEWARTAEDILWRRTKLGLRMEVKEVKVLEEYIEEQKE